METKPGWLILAVFVPLLMGSMLGFWAGASNGKRNHEAEAVKAGHAQFIVINEYGATKFEWLPNHGPEKPLPALEKK